MKSFDWVYLCNDPAKLELFMDFLPPIRDLGIMHIVTDTRNAIMIPEFERICRGRTVMTIYRTDFNEKEITFSKMTRAQVKAIKNYPIFSKLTFPGSMPVKFLFTDDDIVCLKDPSDMIAEHGHIHSATGLFDKYDIDCTAHLRELKALEDVFGFELDAYEYNDCSCDAAIWTCDPDDSFNDLLAKFYDHPYFFDYTDAGWSSRMNCFDQRLLTMYFSQRKGHRMFSRREYCRWTQRFEKKAPFPKTYTPMFLHYAAVKWKPQYMDWIRSELNARRNG